MRECHVCLSLKGERSSRAKNGGTIVRREVPRTRCARVSAVRPPCMCVDASAPRGERLASLHRPIYHKVGTQLHGPNRCRCAGTGWVGAPNTSQRNSIGERCSKSGNFTHAFGSVFDSWCWPNVLSWPNTPNVFSPVPYHLHVVVPNH